MKKNPKGGGGGGRGVNCSNCIWQNTLSFLIKWKILSIKLTIFLHLTSYSGWILSVMFSVYMIIPAQLVGFEPATPPIASSAVQHPTRYAMGNPRHWCDQDFGSYWALRHGAHHNVPSVQLYQPCMLPDVMCLHHCHDDANHLAHSGSHNCTKTIHR